MKKKLILLSSALLLFCCALIVGRISYVVSELNAKEAVIKKALAATSGQESHSNADDGAERFIKSGELLFEPSYLLHPEKIINLTC
jgi:hypothetical protein